MSKNDDPIIVEQTFDAAIATVWNASQSQNPNIK